MTVRGSGLYDGNPARNVQAQQGPLARTQQGYGQPARQLPNVQAQYPGHARPVAGRGTPMPVVTPGSSSTPNQTYQVGRTVITQDGHVLPGTEKGRRR